MCLQDLNRGRKAFKGVPVDDLGFTPIERPYRGMDEHARMVFRLRLECGQ